MAKGSKKKKNPSKKTPAAGVSVQQKRKKEQKVVKNKKPKLSKDPAITGVLPAVQSSISSTSGAGSVLSTKPLSDNKYDLRGEIGSKKKKSLLLLKNSGQTTSVEIGPATTSSEAELKQTIKGLEKKVKILENTIKLLFEKSMEPLPCDTLKVIIDTNVLLHYKRLFDQILNVRCVIDKDVTVCLPYDVILELDRMKGNENKEDKIKTRARKCILDVLNLLKTKTPHFYGQSIEEMTAYKTIHGKSADDRIVEFCKGLQKRCDPSVVVLLTHDNNLKIKALLWHVQVVDPGVLEKKLQKKCPLSYEEFKE